MPEIVKTGMYVENIATSTVYEHVLDEINRKRIIQSISYETFEINITFAQNIHIGKIAGINQLLVETDNYGNFIAYDVEVDVNEKSSRNNNYTIKFKKLLVINYELTSEFAEKINNDKKVIVINYKVKNPRYAIFGDIIFENDFKLVVKNKKEFENITQGEYYYIHNSYINDNGCNYVEVSSVSNNIFFKLLNFTGSTREIYNIQIDNEIDIEEHSEVTEKEINLKIYTFLKPKLKFNSIFDEEIELKNSIKFYGSNYFNKFLTLKYWLNEDEYYKYRFLTMASEIFVKDENDNNIYGLTKNLITKEKENENFIKIKEFDFEMIFEVVNYQNNEDVIL